MPSTPSTIIPTLPPSSQASETSDHEAEDTESVSHGEGSSEPGIDRSMQGHERSPVTQESYEIPLPRAPQSIRPATSLSELLQTEGSRSAKRRRIVESSEEDEEDGLSRSNNDEVAEDEEGYRPAFRLPAELQPSPPTGGTENLLVDLTDGPSRSESRSTSSSSLSSLPLINHVPGKTSNSAIVIQESPTPPLRPLASPQARAEAVLNGRCGIVDSGKEPSPEKEEEKLSLGELVCPVCLGPPTPLAVTECGHAFCGPCLHSALTSQPITAETLRDIPTIGGKALEGTCPVCRHVLRGGWGRAIRGAVIRVAEIEIPI